MIFDKMCGIIERHFPDYTILMQEANVFHIPKSAQEVMFESEIQNQNSAHSLFQLPFPVTAIEHKDRCLLAVDLEDNAIGLNNPRFVMTYTPWIPELEDQEFNKNNIIYNKFKMEGILSAGTIHTASLTNENKWKIEFDIHLTHLVAKKKSPIDLFAYSNKKNKDKIEHTYSLAKKFYIGGLELLFHEILMFSSPNFFITKETPVHIKNSKKTIPKNKVARTHQRPLYTILRPHEIRRKLNLDTPSAPDRKRGSPIPHERRAHLRQLKKGNKYKEDKIVRVKASWIGDSEKTIGNKHYKVILDR